jgi:CRP-like cAMP-binding protein
MEDVTMQAEAKSGRMDAVAAHPLAELLECPPTAANLLNGAAQCLDFDAGDVVFRQQGVCKGLYVVVSGLFVRKAERLKTRLTLGSARAGDLVELAAALGDGHHTYSLSAQTSGSLLLLPIEALNQVFENYPPLRMRLLEELAREVSRAYLSCCLNRTVHVRRRGNNAAEPAQPGA